MPYLCFHYFSFRILKSVLGSRDRKIAIVAYAPLNPNQSIDQSIDVRRSAKDYLSTCTEPQNHSNKSSEARAKMVPEKYFQLCKWVTFCTGRLTRAANRSTSADIGAFPLHAIAKHILSGYFHFVDAARALPRLTGKVARNATFIGYNSRSN